jgi:hypothetical protein
LNRSSPASLQWNALRWDAQDSPSFQVRSRFYPWLPVPAGRLQGCLRRDLEAVTIKGTVPFHLFRAHDFSRPEGDCPLFCHSLLHFSTHRDRSRPILRSTRGRGKGPPRLPGSQLAKSATAGSMQSVPIGETSPDTRVFAAAAMEKSPNPCPRLARRFWRV